MNCVCVAYVGKWLGVNCVWSRGVVRLYLHVCGV